MNVLTFEEALTEVLRHAEILRQSRSGPTVEAVPLLEAFGRVLAEPVLADRDQPPFDRATRDGFAVRAAEISRGSLRITGQVRAGELWPGTSLESAAAIEIMTGAPVPPGADAVVMIEHAEVIGNIVRLAAGRTSQPGQNIVPQASEAKRGEIVVAAGSPVGAAQIALAASCGRSDVQAFARPGVAILPTGDELVELDRTPATHQIRNSNSYALAAMVTAAGGSAERLEIALDLREQLRDRIAEARRWDLMLLSGGVSMGKYDLVEEVLAEFGAEFFFTGVKMQPGRPLVFGRLPKLENACGAGPECYFFGLPGNPISTQVTFHCFVEPFLRIIRGESTAGPKFVQATLAEDIAGHPERTRILPALLSYDLKQPTVRLVSWHGSGDLAANAKANCYAVLPSEKAEFRKDEVISILLR